MRHRGLRICLQINDSALSARPPLPPFREAGFNIELRDIGSDVPDPTISYDVPFEELDFLIYAGYHLDEPLLSKIAQACRGHSIPWTPLIFGNHETYAGPLMGLPHTPCYECLSERLRGANNDEPLRLHRSTFSPLEARRIGAGTRAGCAFIELEVLAMFLGTHPSCTYGCVVVIDLSTAAMHSHRVVSVPSCVICFGDEPRIRPWAV